LIMNVWREEREPGKKEQRKKERKKESYMKKEKDGWIDGPNGGFEGCFHQ